jgi:hypothetical protein
MIRSFSMLAATKLVYVFKRPMWDEALTYMCHTGVCARWWTSSHGMVRTELNLNRCF